jgi:hypothetical protein
MKQATEKGKERVLAMMFLNRVDRTCYGSMLVKLIMLPDNMMYIPTTGSPTLRLSITGTMVTKHHIKIQVTTEHPLLKIDQDC